MLTHTPLDEVAFIHRKRVLERGTRLCEHKGSIVLFD
jgi:hypothetical protein